MKFNEKMNVSKYFLLVLFLSLGLQNIIAQEEEHSGELEHEEHDEHLDPHKNYIVGFVFDQNTKTPLEYATVSVFDSKTDTIIQGILVDAEGMFEIELDKTNSDVYIIFEFLGYKPKKVNDLIFEQQEIDLPDVYLSPDIQQLDEIVVTGEVSRTVFKLDRRIFNVGKDLTSSGASTLEILENIPSVTTDLKGTISLRGNSNVKVLINGNASASTSNGTTALNGIAPDMIERVEVITNPSAKYDAAGTAGILNIILKKERKSGLNGVLNLQTGVPNNHSLGVYLNYRTEKLSINGGVKGGYNTYITTDESLARDKTMNPIQSFYANGKGESDSKVFNANLGLDYNLTNTDFISVGGALGISKGNRAFNYDYHISDLNGNVENTSKRREDTNTDSPNHEYFFNYKKTLKGNEEHSLEVKYNALYFADFFTSFFINSGDILSNAQQRSNTDFTERGKELRLDYTYPFAEEGELEVGAKYNFQKMKNRYRVDDLVDGAWMRNTDYSNVFFYNENLLAVYATFAQEYGKFGIKTGLRLERTKFKTLLEETNEESVQNYTNLFPSVHTSYKFTEAFSMQMSFSRRISRPNMHTLNPFESISDNFSQFQGNPALQPEYSNSYELGTIKDFDNGSLSATLYARTSTNTVERTQTVNNGITIIKPFNIGKRNDLGLELNANYKVNKWWRISSDFNWFYYKRTGRYLEQNFNFNSNQWMAGLISKFKLPITLDAEVSVNYRSKRKLLLVTIDDYFYTNLGLKKKLLKNRVALSFTVRDLLNTRNFGLLSDLDSFYRSQSTRWQGRRFTLGASIQLGKAEVEKNGSFHHGGGFHH